MNDGAVPLEKLQRVAVIGTSCSGKTTFARRLATLLDVRHVELDALYWAPKWQARPVEELRRSVSEEVEGSRWICDGNYSPVRDLVWGRATAVVWLDYSFPLVFRRALGRTLRRGITGQELFSGNRESLWTAFFSRDSILLWVLTTYRRNRREIPQLFQQEEFTHLHTIRFKRPRTTEEFLNRVKAAKKN